MKINNYQRRRFSQKIISGLEDNTVNKIGILGWAFKANTNDSRESSSIYIARNLIDYGLDLNIYDPMVNEKRIYSDLNSISEKEINKKQVKVYSSFEEAINNVNIVIVLTEWKEFKEFDWRRLTKNSRNKIKIYDGRNILINQLSNYPDYYKL